MESHRRNLIAHVLPMFLFLALLGLGQGLHVWRGFFFQHSEFWIFPLQTFLCSAALFWFWRCYTLGAPQKIFFTLAVGIAVFLLWISPQQFLGSAPRTDGFNPDLLAGRASIYWVEIFLRFARLVVVVPFLEEIFWRGFLLRFLIDENFEQVPFGKFSWFSFVVVSLLFCFSHSRPDWPAAILTGVIYNFVAYRTRSLTSCVLAHGLTNLLLGIWVMKTGQWGLW